TM
ncbi:IFN-alpha/beta-receptor-like secreted glycoprotein, partial [Monkeypox virus]